MLAWILLGSEIGIIISRINLSEKTKFVVREEADIQATMTFLRDVFLTDPTDFVNPDAPRIKDLAKENRVPVEIYDFVKTNIKYNPSKGIPSDVGAWGKRESSCFGIAALVTSLLRANGVPESDVHVTAALLEGKQGSQHAWTELKIGNNWQVIDPTTFVFQNPAFVDDGQRLIMSREKYLEPWSNRNILFEYNDKSFRFSLNE